MPTEPSAEMRVIVCGSRHYTDRGRIEARLELIPQPFTLVHGGATGVDAIAAGWGAAQAGVTVEVHPADWSMGRPAGPIRNAKMIAYGADLVLAFPWRDSRGTWDCVNKARAAGIPVEVDLG